MTERATESSAAEIVAWDRNLVEMIASFIDDDLSDVGIPASIALASTCHAWQRGLTIYSDAVLERIEAETATSEWCGAIDEDERDDLAKLDARLIRRPIRQVRLGDWTTAMRPRIRLAAVVGRACTTHPHLAFTIWAASVHDFDSGPWVVGRLYTTVASSRRVLNPFDGYTAHVPSLVDQISHSMSHDNARCPDANRSLVARIAWHELIGPELFVKMLIVCCRSVVSAMKGSVASTLFENILRRLHSIHEGSSRIAGHRSVLDTCEMTSGMTRLVEEIGEQYSNYCELLDGGFGTIPSGSDFEVYSPGILSAIWTALPLIRVTIDTQLLRAARACGTYAPFIERAVIVLTRTPAARMTCRLRIPAATSVSTLNQSVSEADMGNLLHLFRSISPICGSGNRSVPCVAAAILGRDWMYLMMRDGAWMSAWLSSISSEQRDHVNAEMLSAGVGAGGAEGVGGVGGTARSRPTPPMAPAANWRKSATKRRPKKP